MSFKAGVGVSQNIQDSRTAGEEAAKRAVEKLGGEKPDIAVVLASSMYDQQELLGGVRSQVSDLPVVGCSTAGLLTNDGLLENSVGVLTLKSDKAKFYPFKVEGISKNMREAGESFANQILENTNKKAKLAFMFSDALSGNGTNLVRGALKVLGVNFPLMGGAAGDDLNFKKTYQYYDGDVITDSVVGFAVSGDIKYGTGAGHGWQPIGNPRTVTKAEGTRVYELDGKPAFLIYKEYFRERAEEFKSALSLAAVSYPLGMKVRDSEDFMIRVPLSVQEDGSIICGAEVLNGSQLYLMVGTMSSALWAAKDVANKAVKQALVKSASIVFISDCVARKILYGERGNEEISLIKSVVGESAQIFGFVSYGQIAPFIKGAEINPETCDPGFYEQSISLAVLGE